MKPIRSPFFFLRVVRRRRRTRRPVSGSRLYSLHKEAARVRVHEKLLVWNALYGFKYNKVAIRNTRSRWGSCSRAGNLNFNYKLLFIPERLFDYVIVHELCHLKEFNHSRAFWDLVAKTIPDYAERRHELRALRKVNVPREPLTP